MWKIQEMLASGGGVETGNVMRIMSQSLPLAYVVDEIWRQSFHIFQKHLVVVVSVTTAFTLILGRLKPKLLRELFFILALMFIHRIVAFMSGPISSMIVRVFQNVDETESSRIINNLLLENKVQEMPFMEDELSTETQLSALSVDRGWISFPSVTTIACYGRIAMHWTVQVRDAMYELVMFCLWGICLAIKTPYIALERMNPINIAKRLEAQALEEHLESKSESFLSVMVAFVAPLCSWTNIHAYVCGTLCSLVYGFISATMDTFKVTAESILFMTSFPVMLVVGVTQASFLQRPFATVMMGGWFVAFNWRLLLDVVFTYLPYLLPGILLWLSQISAAIAADNKELLVTLPFPLARLLLPFLPWKSTTLLNTLFMAIAALAAWRVTRSKNGIHQYRKRFFVALVVLTGSFQSVRLQDGNYCAALQHLGKLLPATAVVGLSFLVMLKELSCHKIGRDLTITRLQINRLLDEFNLKTEGRLMTWNYLLDDLVRRKIISWQLWKLDEIAGLVTHRLTTLFLLIFLAIRVTFFWSEESFGAWPNSFWDFLQTPCDTFLDKWALSSLIAFLGSTMCNSFAALLRTHQSESRWIMYLTTMGVLYINLENIPPWLVIAEVLASQMHLHLSVATMNALKIPSELQRRIMPAAMTLSLLSMVMAVRKGSDYGIPEILWFDHAQQSAFLCLFAWVHTQKRMGPLRILRLHETKAWWRAFCALATPFLPAAMALLDGLAWKENVMVPRWALFWCLSHALFATETTTAEFSRMAGVANDIIPVVDSCNIDQSECCALCRVPLVRRSKVKILKCHHGLHLECIPCWLAQESGCPTCGRPIFSFNIRCGLRMYRGLTAMMTMDQDSIDLTSWFGLQAAGIEGDWMALIGANSQHHTPDDKRQAALRLIWRRGLGVDPTFKTVVLTSEEMQMLVQPQWESSFLKVVIESTKRGSTHGGNHAIELGSVPRPSKNARFKVKAAWDDRDSAVLKGRTIFWTGIYLTLMAATSGMHKLYLHIRDL